MGIASLVLGIIATLLGIAPGMFFFAMPVAVIAVVLGILGRKTALDNGQPTGTAVAGLVLGIVGLTFAVAMWVMCHLIVSGTKSAFEKNIGEPIKKAIEKAQQQQKQERENGLQLDPNPLKVTAVKLFEDYAANSAAADKRYVGRTLEVTGKVQSIRAEGPYVNLDLEVDPEEPDELEYVRCALVKSQNDKAMKKKKGDQVTVVGRFDGYVLSYKLKGCLLK